MDTSETYIKMADCEEMQKQWKPSIGDCYFKPATNEFEKDELVYIISLKVNHFGTLLRLPNIWLPRQDQLQKMVDWKINGKPFKDLLFQVEAIQHFGTIKNTSTFTTWGQLWLAFAMSELHQKKWDGDNWVK